MRVHCDPHVHLSINAAVVAMVSHRLGDQQHRDRQQADRADGSHDDVIDAAGQGENIGAWAVQNLLPKLQKNKLDAAKNGVITRKFISVTGAPAHILFHETNRTGLADDTTATSRFDPQAPILSDMPETASLCHRSGKRIWPV